MDLKRRFGVLALTLVAVGCTEPGRTTGIGAATGGVLGAGLGAIVGNQVGSAGSGLALGAVAGSSAGALVGNSLEAQEAAIRSQDEALERQEQMIAAQRKELDELRRGRGDDSSASASSLPSWQNRPRRPYQYGERLSVERPAPVAARPAPTLAARVLPKIERRTEFAVEKPALVPPPPVPAPREEFAAPVEPSGNTGALKETDITLDAPLEAAVIPPSTDTQTTLSEEQPPQQEQLTAVVGAGQGAILNERAALEGAIGDSDRAHAALDETGSLAEPAALNRSASAECKKAEEEIHKGQQAAESADQLFHYRRALRLCPDNPSYHNRLGELYVALNRRSDARFEFNEALTLDPTFEPARQNLSALGQ